jgi:hypothetical protein
MVVESADTADLKFAARKSVRVRPPAIPLERAFGFPLQRDPARSVRGKMSVIEL